jgi:hypothetical protein
VAFGADVTKKNASPSLSATRPAPSDKTSQPTATKEPSVSETGAPKKELERAKSDVFTAKASEALAQRKLADAEAALQRVKEEAGLATAEAGRAKAAHGCKKCLRLGGKVANNTRDTEDKMRLLVMAEAWLDLADRANRFAKSHARSIANHPLVRRVFGGEATAQTQPWAG